MPLSPAPPRRPRPPALTGRPRLPSIRAAPPRAARDTARRPSVPPLPPPPPPTPRPPPPPSSPPSFDVTAEELPSFGVTAEELTAALDARAPVPPRLPSLAALAAALATSPTEGVADPSPAGLAARREAFGANCVPEKAPVPLWRLAVAALNDPTVAILVAAALASLALDAALGSGGGGGGGGGGAAAGVDGWIDAVAILVAVAVVVGVTAINDYQSDAVFRELAALSSDPPVRVVRDGGGGESPPLNRGGGGAPPPPLFVPSSSLVVGDLLPVAAGDVLAADGALVRADGGGRLTVDESALTGESVAVAKAPGDALFSGSRVLDGAGALIITAVGPRSQAGAVMASVAGAEGGLFGDLTADGGRGGREQTSLEKKLEALAATIGKGGAAAAAVVGAALAAPTVTGLVAAPPSAAPLPAALPSLLHAATVAVTVLVVAVPEGLPLAVTVALAASVRRMAADAVLVRRLAAAETMGAATVVLTDKTGTLTRGEMAVTDVWVASGGGGGGGLRRVAARDAATLPPALAASLTASLALNSTALLDGGVAAAAARAGNGAGAATPRAGSGSPTEVALLAFAAAATTAADVDAVRASHPVLALTPFSSDTKIMATAVRDGGGGGGVTLHVKGAADALLPLCATALAADGATLLPLDRDAASAVVDAACRDGGRVIAVARAAAPSLAPDGAIPPSALASGLTLLALASLADPLRPDTAAAVARVRGAGVRVVMVTGDAPATAAAVARDAGILDADAAADGAVVTGADLRAWLAAEGGASSFLTSRWPALRVVARCTPRDKLDLVRALKRGGGSADAPSPLSPPPVVAVTGDGVNDAPALAAADVGFAMAGGAPVARAAADIILVDDSFAGVVAAAAWGRNVYASVAKFLTFQLTCSIVAVGVAAGGALATQESPLTAVQMLWINLVMDALASLALATDAPGPDALAGPPPRQTAPLLTPCLLKHVAGQAAYQGVIMAWLIGGGGAAAIAGGAAAGASSAVLPGTPAGTVVFHAFVTLQLFNLVNCRKAGDARDVLAGAATHTAFLAVLGAEVLLQAAIVQWGGAVFDTVPLRPAAWAACAGLGAASLLVRAALAGVPPRAP